MKSVRAYFSKDVALIEPEAAAERQAVKAACEGKASLFEKTFGRPTG